MYYNSTNQYWAASGYAPDGKSLPEIETGDGFKIYK